MQCGMLTACKDSGASLKCTQITLESWLLLESESDSPLASGAVGRAACSPEFYPTASAAAQCTKNAWNVRKAWKPRAMHFLCHLTKYDMYPYSDADLMPHNLTSLTDATWDPIWNLVHLPHERILSFYQPHKVKFYSGFFCSLSMAAQLSEKSQSKLQERHFLFTFSEVTAPFSVWQAKWDWRF